MNYKLIYRYIGKGLGKSGSKWWVESCRLEILNLVGLGWDILAVGVGYQLTIPADEGNNLGFALFGMRANQDRPEMLPIMRALKNSAWAALASTQRSL